LITLSARSRIDVQIDAERLGSLEIDDRLELDRPLERQIARFGAFENLVDE
jgi:hypothetical protein